MRFLANYRGEVFIHKSLRAIYFSNCVKNLNFLKTTSQLKIPGRNLVSVEKELHPNSNQDFHHALAKTESLYSSHVIRNLLYPETDDEIINQLKSCYDIADLIQIINTNESLTHQQLNQIILVLRDFQKLHTIHHVLRNDKQNMNDLYDSLPFKKLLALVESNMSKMNADEITCSLLYLNKMNVSCNERVMMKLIDACEKLIFQCNRNSALQNLSRFFIVIRGENNIWSLYTMSQYLPFLIECLDNCENRDDFRHITVCFQKCVPLLNADIMNKYIAKLDIILQNDVDSEDISNAGRTIVKSIVFLNFRCWNSSFIKEVKKLLTAVKDKIHQLCLTEISLLHKAILSIQEPFDLSQEIDRTIKNWITTHQDTETPIPIFVIQIFFPGLKLISDSDIKHHLIEYVEKDQDYDDGLLSFPAIYHMIFNTNLKFDKSLTYTFWLMLNNKLKVTKQKNTDKYFDNLSWCVHRYIHLIGSQKFQRNDFFEKSLVSHITLLLRDKHFKCNPSEYSKFALALLALCSKNPFDLFTDNVWQKLYDHLSQLSIYDNLFVCLILKVAFDRYKKPRPGLTQFLHHQVRLNAITNENVLNSLRSNYEFPPEKLNTIFHSHILTTKIKTSGVFSEVCNRFQEIEPKQLHSKIIRDCIFNFNLCEHLIPEFTNVVVEYCVSEKNALFGGTVACVLNYCFLFGFTPTKLDEFLTIASSVIDRDKESISKSIYLQCALSLAYFRELPSSWCDYIFNLKFLEQLDGYFDQLNFMKTKNLRNELMELNRVVCMEYPYREIPWFHEKYCQELIALERQKTKAFLTSVLNVLRSFIKEDSAIDINYITPYGHKIDVVLHLNKKNSLMNTRNCDPSELRKIAIILRTNTPSTYYKGKGKVELCLRQLEMLNYEVLLLNRQEWNSMYLSNLEEKVNYLQQLIRAA